MFMEFVRKDLFFGLFDVVVKGKMNVTPDISYLAKLSDYCRESKVNLWLITGLLEENGRKIVVANGLDKIFSQDKIIYLTKAYLEHLSEMDRSLREERCRADPDYCDDYFKVFFLNDLVDKGVISKEKTLFVGHDVWADGFYLRRYSKIDFLLLESTLSNNHKLHIDKVYGLHIIKPSLEIFQDYLSNEKKFDYSSLDRFAGNVLQQNILGKIDLSKINFSKVLNKKKTVTK